MSNAVPTVQGHLSDLAVLYAEQHGPGALWVAHKAKPVYRTMDRVEPPRFRAMLQKSWDEEHHSFAFIVVHEKDQLHVVKVRKPLDADVSAEEVPTTTLPLPLSS